jgi:hypothetical protein
MVEGNPVLEKQLREKILSLCLTIMAGTDEENRAFRRAFEKMPTVSLLAHNVANI